MMLAELADPKWWFSAVLVAVLVNVASAYLKHPTDRLVSMLAGVFRRHHKRGREHWEGRLALAKSSNRALLVEIAREGRYRSKVTFHTLVVFVTALVLASVQAQPDPTPQLSRVLLVICLISGVSGLVNLFRAMDVHDLVLRSVERSTNEEIRKLASRPASVEENNAGSRH